MTTDELLYSIDLLESSRQSGAIPGPSLDRIIGFLYSEIAQQEESRIKRDEALRAHQFELPATSTWGRAAVLRNEARRLHGGRKSSYAWLDSAHRIKPLPLSQGQLFRILSR